MEVIYQQCKSQNPLLSDTKSNLCFDYEVKDFQFTATICVTVTVTSSTMFFHYLLQY